MIDLETPAASASACVVQPHKTRNAATRDPRVGVPMSTNVESSANVVNERSVYDRSDPWHDDGVDDWRAAKTLRDRLAWVMRARDLKPTPWSTAAGLSHGYINAFMGRGEAADMKTSEVAALARVAHVSPGWLATGEGEPGSVDAPSPERTVVYDERYPNREKALAPLIPELRPRTPARIRSVTFASYRDLSVLEWTRHILAEDERVRFEEEHGVPEGSITKEILEQGAKDHPDLPPPPAKWPGGRRPKKP